MRLIVDSSVAIKWVIDEPDTDQAESLRRFELQSIDLLWIECSKVLWKLSQCGRVTISESHSKLALLTATSLAIHRTASLLRRALEIACELGHPVYDCLYLAAAEREQTRVVTADVRLLNKLAAAPGRFTHLAVSLQDAAAN